MIKIIFPIFCILVSVSTMRAYAEILTLKTGQIYNNVKILERTPEYVKAEIFGADFIYYPHEIKSLEKQGAKKSLIPITEEPLKEYIMNIGVIDKEIGDKLEQDTPLINTLVEQGRKDQAIQLVLADVNLMLQKLKYVQDLTAPAKAQGLKDVFVRYYKSMLEVQAALLKSLTNVPGAPELLENNMKSMIQLENDFKTKLQAMAKPYEITLPIHPVSIPEIKTETIADPKMETKVVIENPSNETMAMIKETLRLIEANKKLQNKILDLLDAKPVAKAEAAPPLIKS